jgi:hypothetical protein
VKLPVRAVIKNVAIDVYHETLCWMELVEPGETALSRSALRLAPQNGKRMKIAYVSPVAHTACL